MIDQIESFFRGNLSLSFFDLWVIEFLDKATIQANQVIVMGAFIQFKDGLAGFEMTAGKNARLLKLRQHPIDRGQTDIDRIGHQGPIDILGGKVPRACAMKNIKHLQPGASHLQAGVLQIMGAGHGPYDSGVSC